MKIYRVEQGTKEWLDLRLGIPCASGFKNVVTPKGAPTASERRDKYKYRLLAERLLGCPMDEKFESHWMARGRELEAQAADAFAAWLGVELEEGCFITTDNGRIGCSPDRIIKGSKRQAVEIKCPSPPVHVGYLLDGLGDDYRQQVQGQLMIGEFEAVHFWSWHPQMPPKHIVTFPERNFIADLAAGLSVFCKRLDKDEAELREMGVFVRGPEPPLVTDLPGIFPWLKPGEALQ